MNQVKIIGLKINHQFGILNACNLKFDEHNKLIIVKGEVGAGKSTLLKAIQLGTLGSNTLEDKELYGTINMETQLLDGGESVFVGCKSDKEGKLQYVLYKKDLNGKIIKNPVIDGIAATPSAYMKDLQTKLTWRMGELVSENLTTQRNLLLDIYKSELISAGVVFNKQLPSYEGSILDRIDQAENTRTIADVKRKEVGGFATHLKDKGFDTSEPDSLPQRIDTAPMEKVISGYQFKKDTAFEKATTDHTNALKSFKNKADEIVNKLKSRNLLKKEVNEKLKAEHDKIVDADDIEIGKISELLELIDSISSDYISTIAKSEVKTTIGNQMGPAIKSPVYIPLVQFDEKGRARTDEAEFEYLEKADKTLLVDLEQCRQQYIVEKAVVISEETISAEGITEKEKAERELESAQENNKICDAIDSSFAWRDADQEVRKLKLEYATMLAGINTGVEGLQISVDDEDEKPQIYMTYNGRYDLEYFNNPNKEQRKIGSYSGTQKPIICLLLQSYLLSKKEKALRYLWLDNVPIDNKTRLLLERMGQELGLTLIVNITGDYDRNTLKDGEMLIEGGQVFFKETEL